MPEEVIELSIEETNKLREELGLKPLRVSEPPKQPKADEKEVLELSVDETNALREKLGLKPLRTSGVSAVVHKPAQNEGHTKQQEEQKEKEELAEEAQMGIQSTFGNATLAEGANDGVLSWAERMRKQKKNKNKKSQQRPEGEKSGQIAKGEYSAQDLEGLNVMHAAADFQAGSTTILTLSDASLLQKSENNKVIGLQEDQTNQLQNVEMADSEAQKDGLQKKRQLEMGMDRAGGYAGYDDDEFEELGGTQGPSRQGRGGMQTGPDDKKRKRKGFVLGSVISDEAENNENDLFAFQSGKAVSLVPTSADETASDFMTVEEDEALTRKKKEAKFKKKKKKKDKKKSRRKTTVDEDDEEDNRGDLEKSEGLLDDLEKTADVSENRRKRRREEDEEAEKQPTFPFQRPAQKPAPISAVQSALNEKSELSKRAKYDSIMEKGNTRTTEAFRSVESQNDGGNDAAPDEEPDDEFLNQALAKARRLQRLRKMASKTNGNTTAKGAGAVLQALQANKKIDDGNGSTVPNETILFAIDDTQEFTRALRARTEQEERQKAKKAAKKDELISTTKKTERKSEGFESEGANQKQAKDEEISTEDMEELAKEIKEDEDSGFVGTANSVGVGRGLSSVLSMLRHTGEITGKNAGREEMRGRAKDERTYEDYQSLDLSEVVRIGKNATDRDRELASREIKLDYRDEHGRLLTRKEAYRQLCYQFHGHGSSKRNQEKRLRQIEREQAEARLASRQAGGRGYLAALKNTQKATGKAFVVHKTT